MSIKLHSLYLLSFTQTWASSSNLHFLKTNLIFDFYLSGRDLSNVIWILTPIHVNVNHRGFLSINMAQQQAFYGDGLKQNNPRNIVEFAHNY